MVVMVLLLLLLVCCCCLMLLMLLLLLSMTIIMMLCSLFWFRFLVCFVCYLPMEWRVDMLLKQKSCKYGHIKTVMCFIQVKFLSI